MGFDSHDWENFQQDETSNDEIRRFWLRQNDDVNEDAEG
jgi:hypothetical protein